MSAPLKQLILPPGKIPVSIKDFSATNEGATLESEIPDESQFGVTHNRGKIKVQPAMIHELAFKSDDEVPNLNPYLAKS